MTKLTIKDLEKNMELDRKAMRDLRGGVNVNVNDFILRVIRASVIEQNKDRKYWKKKLGQFGI